MSTQATKERVSGQGEGLTAEVFDATRAKNAGPSEKIRRIVTKVERYHSCDCLVEVCRECWSLPGFTVFC